MTKFKVDFAGVMDRLEELERESHRLRKIINALADSKPIRSDADGFDFCGVCGSTENYAGMIQHEDDCPYLMALQARQTEADEWERAK